MTPAQTFSVKRGFIVLWKMGKLQKEQHIPQAVSLSLLSDSRLHLLFILLVTCQEQMASYLLDKMVIGTSCLNANCLLSEPDFFPCLHRYRCTP